LLATRGSEPIAGTPPFGAEQGTRLKTSLADLAACFTVSMARAASVFGGCGLGGLTDGATPVVGAGAPAGSDGAAGCAAAGEPTGAVAVWTGGAVSARASGEAGPASASTRMAHAQKGRWKPDNGINQNS
jgi:hypothetical protein